MNTLPNRSLSALGLVTLSALLAACGSGGEDPAAPPPTATATAAPTVVLAASTTSVVVGNSATLTWSSTDAITCTASGAWSGNRPLSGSATTGTLTSASNTFILTCSGVGGTDSKSVTVAVAPVTPAPTVTLSATPSTVTTGDSANLTWSSTSATACVATGAWGGSRPTLGTATTGALSAATNSYTLTCTGAGGSANQTAIVAVTSAVPAPTVSISATPTSVGSGASSSLTWSSTNATACTASGAWLGSRATAGSSSTGPLTAATNTFTLTCTGTGGSDSRSATVSVTPTAPAPTVQLSANPAQVAVGNAALLTWTSTNATACTAAGAWTGSRGASGNESTGALAASQTYTLTCTGAGGSASRSVVVTVNSGNQFGLDFQGNASTAGTVRFEFTNPLAIYPATYIWKVRPRQQNGYYTTFFWGNNGAFWWDAGSPNTYYGAHPYPDQQPNGSTHKWEVAVDAGDEVDDANGNDTTVVYDRWHTQALRVWSDSAGKHHEFYWDLPDTTRVIRALIPSRYGNTNPPAPVLVWGDAPWNPSNEILNGVLRGIQVYSVALSVTDVLAESTTPLSTASGASTIWYLNLNPTPGDIADKSGSGHHPSWVGAERPLLWSGQ